MTISGQVMSLNIGQILQMTFKDQLLIHSKRFDKRNTRLVKLISCKFSLKLLVFVEKQLVFS